MDRQMRKKQHRQEMVHSPIMAAILVIILTTVATMYLVAGATKKAVCASMGTILGVIISGFFAWFFSKMTEISGYNVSDIEDLVYVQEQIGIEVGELLFCGILIAALGAVMDVAMSITSTIEELSINNPLMDYKKLFQSGMKVGRDMMGTMSNTLVLAFAGGSINTTVFLYVYNYPYRQMINMFSLGIEIIQGVAASIGVILIVPIVLTLPTWTKFLMIFQRKPLSLRRLCLIYRVVELQIRTILMDAWSSLDSILVYKKNTPISNEMKSDIHKIAKWSRKMDKMVAGMIEHKNTHTR